jgi:hypothetical protein
VPLHRTPRHLHRLLARLPCCSPPLQLLSHRPCRPPPPRSPLPAPPAPAPSAPHAPPPGPPSPPARSTTAAARACG